MKQCNTCKEVKSLDYFTKNYNKYYDKYYVRPKCKTCRNKEVSNKVKAKRKDKVYYVYYLPVHNYCGITVDLDMRMRDHRRTGRNNRDTSGMRVLYASTDRVEAAHHEVMFQSVLGMNGLLINFK